MSTNKYNLSKVQVVDMLRRVADRLPDDVLNKLLIETLEQHVPELMKLAEKYKNVPLAIGRHHLKTHLGIFTGGGEDLSEVLNFNKENLDIGNMPYNYLILLAELGKLPPMATTRMDSSSTFTIYAYSNAWVFGSQTHYEFGASRMGYKLYVKTKVQTRSKGYGGEVEQFAKVESHEVILSDLLPGLTSTPPTDRTVRARIPMSWVKQHRSVTTREDMYDIKFPDHTVWRMPNEAFQRANAIMDYRSDTIELDLPVHLAEKAREQMEGYSYFNGER